MLVYAVKNKDGKYDMDCCDVNGNELFSSDISMSNWIYNEEDAKEFLYGDRCEIVPVTICEGDLEKEIIDLKRQIERLKIEKDDLEDLVDKIRDNDPMITNLKAQIAEKEIFIKELQRDNRELRKGLNKSGLDYFIKSSNIIRKQVCDEIRKKMTVYRYTEVKTKNGYEWALTDSNINEILDQIEQAKENMKDV